MKSHADCTHGPGNAWTSEPTQKFFAHCDTCRTFRLWGNYFEVYDIDVDMEGTAWWWECEMCLIQTASDYSEVYTQT